MVSQALYEKKLRQFQKQKLSRGLSNSFFPSKKVQRNFPIQGALHILLDGALIGVLITVAIMSSLALHSQHLWTESFTKLEKTRDLNRRILESTSILESYLLKNQKLSKSLVSTKAENLIYVDRPSLKNTRSLLNDTLIQRVFKKIASLPIKSGY